jgi:hypothetical protein
MKSNRTHCLANVIGLLSFICVGAWHADAQTNGTDDAHMTMIRERIQTFVNQTIKSGETVIIIGGPKVTARTFVPLSKVAVEQVKGYEDLGGGE